MKKLIISQDELDRLTAKLDEAFHSLPGNVQKILRAFCPRFDLIPKCEVQENSRQTIAWVEESGRVAFYAPLVAQLDAKALCLVAHQAAHAVLLAIGGDWLNEQAVDELATRWGYDMDRLNAYRTLDD